MREDKRGPRPHTRFWTYLIFSLSLVLSPVVYEYGLVVYGNWQSMLGRPLRAKHARAELPLQHVQLDPSRFTTPVQADAEPRPLEPIDGGAARHRLRGIRRACAPQGSLTGRVESPFRVLAGLTCVRANVHSTRLRDTAPKWRNGRRAGLKIRWGNTRVGSSPTFGTRNLRRTAFGLFHSRPSLQRIEQTDETTHTELIPSSLLLRACTKFRLPIEPIRREDIDRLGPVAEGATRLHQAVPGELAVQLSG